MTAAAAELEQAAAASAAAADAPKKNAAHNPAIDTQIKQYSKSQGISAAHVEVDDGHVDAAQHRKLEAQLIELKLYWALVRRDLVTFFLALRCAFDARISASL